jgi:hypothetical protein
VIKENSGGNDFKYDVFDTLKELLLIPQCTPTQHNNKRKKVAAQQIHASL